MLYYGRDKCYKLVKIFVTETHNSPMGLENGAFITVYDWNNPNGETDFLIIAQKNILGGNLTMKKALALILALVLALSMAVSAFALTLEEITVLED